MRISQWFVAYSQWPGRYLVFRIERPGWVCVFDHVREADGCQLVSPGAQSLDADVQGEQFNVSDVQEQAFRVMERTASWFQPFPICTAPEPELKRLTWLFGTSPLACEESRTLLAVRLFEEPQIFAQLSFDENGVLLEVEMNKEGCEAEVVEAFRRWKDNAPQDRTIERFTHSDSWTT